VGTIWEQTEMSILTPRNDGTLISDLIILFRFALLLGAIGLIGGYALPLLLFPDASLGPLWGIFVTGPLGFAAGLVMGAIGLERGRRQRQGNMCTHCGYDLRSQIPDAADRRVCPECGTNVKTS
jgi:hypothetical protein